MAKILGIDLGTTYSAMAYVEGGQPKIIENSEGARTTPSIVAVSKAGERLVGLLAKRQAITNPTNTIFGIKRLMGHRFDDSHVKRDKEIVPFVIERSDDGGVRVKLGDKHHRPEEISAMILQKLKRDAEAKLGEKIEEAVITVPAYFDDSQRKATRDAGEIAGFKVKRIINEPTAAALAYGFNKKKDEQIAVYDFGGGTFDVSILDITGEEGEQSIQVKSTDGDSHMGGDDIDQKIIHWIADEFKKESGINVTKDPLALQRLKEAAEKTKHELSETLESEINIPFITSDASGPRHLLLKMTRAKLEDLAREFIDRSIEITRRALKVSGYKLTDIDEVILVGGQTRMPAIAAAVKNFFNKELNRSINPDEVVAVGAAIQAGIFQGDVKDVLLLDVIPLSFGIETLGGVNTKVIERNTTIPVSKSQIFSTAADNQTSVEIHVLQGERPMVADNKSLGRFILDGLPPARRGLPQIEVSFDIDASGILSVKARDKATGREQSIRIEARSSLKPEEIERMKQEAEVHAEEDRRKREEAEARNAADQLVYVAEKALRDLPAGQAGAAGQVSDELKKEVEEKISKVKQARDSGAGLADLNRATAELSSALSKIGEAIQRQAGAAPNDQPPGDNQTGDANIRDAETK